MSVMKTTKAKPCGCKRVVCYDDDPNFNGYDTDREEVNITLCTNHKEDMKILKEEESHVKQQMKAISESLSEIQSRQKSLLKFEN